MKVIKIMNESTNEQGIILFKDSNTILLEKLEIDELKRILETLK